MNAEDNGEVHRGGSQMTPLQRGTTGSVCSGPVTRRAFLRLGPLSLTGISLADVLAGRAAAGEANKDTSVILLYLHGGPSHLETYDLKPDAPSAYRSIFRPLATNVPGISLCELF